MSDDTAGRGSENGAELARRRGRGLRGAVAPVSHLADVTVDLTTGPTNSTHGQTSVATRANGTNGHANGTNGHANGKANGSNGHTQGYADLAGPRQHGAPPVSYTCSDGVAVATLASAETRNALSPELLDALDAACQVAVEEGAEALVIVGTGRTFSAGGDLAGVNDVLRDPALDDVAEIAVMVDRLHHVIATLRALPMPTVAAVNGTAVGAGVSLALAADVRVVARSASFVTGYLAVAATPDGGASYHLARALGSPQALSSLLLNRRFTSDDLLRTGLADVVAEDVDVLAAAKDVARGLAVLSFPTVKAVRELVDSASSHSLAEHLDAERAQFLRTVQTPAFRDAVAPFVRRSVTAPA